MDLLPAQFRHEIRTTICLISVFFEQVFFSTRIQSCFVRKEGPFGPIKYNNVGTFELPNLLMNIEEITLV